MKLGKAAGPSEVIMDMIIASGTFGVGVMKKLCQRVLDGEGMPEEWKTSVVVPIFKGKGGVMDCGAYGGVKLLERAMMIVERLLENRIRELVIIDEMQFGFMPAKGRTHTLFILRRMQEEFRGREKKLYMCFLDLEKAFDSSGAGTFFGQGGLKIVRSCQRLGGFAPQTPLFSNARFYEQDTQQTYFDRHQLHARSSDRNFFRIIFYRGKQDCLLPLGFSNHARITTHVFVKCKYLNHKTKK